MGSSALRETILRLLHHVQTPAQYIGGELNSIVKDHRQVRGKLCLAFPDLYTLGMSHHGLQVLYTLLNSDPQWVCERVFTPWPDFEQLLRQHGLPLYSLETFTAFAIERGRFLANDRRLSHLREASFSSRRQPHAKPGGVFAAAGKARFPWDDGSRTRARVEQSRRRRAPRRRAPATDNR